MNPAEQKKNLRQQLRSARRALSPEQQKLAASACSKQLPKLDCWTTSRHIAFYVASDGELDAAPCISIARELGKQVYLPLIVGRELAFGYCKAGDKLRPGRYGIPQPPEDAPRIDPRDLDIVVLPLVGFDRRGNRLGMGGGFYDRYLGALRNTSEKPKLIGFGHALQEVEEIPREPWDQRLDAVITDRELVLTINDHR